MSRTTAELVALAHRHQFVPRAERAGRRPLREIACRRCGRLTRHDGTRWVHEHDGAAACIQPEAVWAAAETP